MDCKAILLDIDGTLVTREGQILPQTKQALLDAQNQGILLVLATGRPARGTAAIAHELEMDRHHGLSVCFNGGQVVDMETGELLFDRAMPPELCRAVLHHMKSFDVRPLIVKGEYSYVTNVYDCMVHLNGQEINIMHHEAHHNGYKLCEVDDLEAFVDFPLNKILNIGEPEYLQAHWEELYAPFRDTLNAMFTAPYYFEFTHKGIDKVKALDIAFTKLGLSPENAIAFGDAENDLTLIRYAGTGVAMGNAVPALKEAADYVTDDLNSEGIYKALRHFGVV